MRIDELRKKRALAARVQAAAALGAVTRLRRSLAASGKEYARQKRQLQKSLARYELALADDPTVIAPSTDAGAPLVHALSEAADAERVELAEIFAELRRQEVALGRRRVRPPRAERIMAKRAKAKAAKLRRHLRKVQKDAAKLTG